jgi:hypothetical protein
MSSVLRVFALAVGLSLSGCAQPEPLVSACLPATGRFEIRHVHSVEKTPVIEIYRAAPDGAIFIEGMRFRSLGWGLPSEGYVLRDGWYVISGLDRRVGVLHLRTSRFTRHELVAGDRTYPLYDRLRDGAGVIVTVSPARACPLYLEVRAASP